MRQAALVLVGLVSLALCGKTGGSLGRGLRGAGFGAGRKLTAQLGNIMFGLYACYMCFALMLELGAV